MPDQSYVSVKTYLFNRDIQTMTKAELMDAIRHAKTKIADLKNIGVKSEYIDAETKRLTDAIALAVAALDA